MQYGCVQDGYDISISYGLILEARLPIEVSFLHGELNMLKLKSEVNKERAAIQPPYAVIL